MKTIQFNTKQILLAAIFTLFAIGSANANGAETEFASGLENITEPELKVESWMVSENHWNTTGKTIYFMKATDAVLEMENWMTDENHFAMQPVVVENEKDEVLKVENWMISETYWN